LWSPESPNLYVLETSTGGDMAATRFGMREFRFDTATKRAYLNGRVYFMRGSNITLHRFFEDPLSGTLPWDQAWVRKLLVDIPHEMHWNSFRFCIGPVPDQWLDIADEAGLLIQNEYFVWTGHDWHGPENQVHFNADQMIREYSEWMRDNWNHPSVAIWDANNETWDPAFGEKIIPAVRGLDLSNRPWENSYNPPAGPDDPVEDHPYEHQTMADGGPAFSMTTLESPNGKAPGAQTGHALVLNEYGWLWLNRDGAPTELTKRLYPALLGKDSTAQQRLALNAYLLAGLTEYWRAYRQYAGVLHFVYLTGSDPMGYTSDHFRDVRKLELHPEFRDYISNAFAPVGVYVSFWQSTVVIASVQSLPVMLVNDEDREVEGRLTLSLENAHGESVATQTAKFKIAALGQETIYNDFKFPQTTGDFLLRAIIDYRQRVLTCPRKAGATSRLSSLKMMAVKPHKFPSIQFQLAGNAYGRAVRHSHASREISRGARNLPGSLSRSVRTGGARSLRRSTATSACIPYPRLLEDSGGNRGDGQPRFDRRSGVWSLEPPHYRGLRRPATYCTASRGLPIGGGRHPHFWNGNGPVGT
jgi:hypothetical protein